MYHNNLHRMHSIKDLRDKSSKNKTRTVTKASSNALNDKIVLITYINRYFIT